MRNDVGYLFKHILVVHHKHWLFPAIVFSSNDYQDTKNRFDGIVKYDKPLFAQIVFCYATGQKVKFDSYFVRPNTLKRLNRIKLYFGKRQLKKYINY